MQKLILIGASAGGVAALTHITAALPADLPATVLIVMHIGARHSLLPDILQKRCPLPVTHAVDRAPLLPGQVLIAPPDCHLTVEQHDGQPRARLWHGPKENYTRPAIDPLFRSAAAAFDGHVIGAILTGYLDDGTAGLQAIKACGGQAVVQDPQEAQVPDMPASAIGNVAVDHVLRVAEMGALLTSLAALPPEAPSAPPPPPAPTWVKVENSFVQGKAGLPDLQRIGKPSGYTCPECGGALWQLDGAAPARFRCHTGHAFTARVLAHLQEEAVEAALWSALRALQEQQRLEQELLRDDPQRAEKLQANIAILQGLLAKSI
ncbi:two-component system chemotaxis response regulator CheB [Duganella sp. 3397]|uniref:chemotaxis protein CheB n=1 Tax=Duganella sp. 3397 TaxID=2817732 RepID=UPI0028547EC7|nr:chemotaxis protein CheB [Duganella sp. 3397]MDR7051287.1 two-component system chemotaxis response regulator CheB [Duganella sp. 3397]